MGTGHKTIEITDDMVIADEPIAKGREDRVYLRCYRNGGRSWTRGP